VDRVLTIKNGNNSSTKLVEELEGIQSQIDLLVYELYEIGSEEIVIIENTF